MTGREHARGVFQSRTGRDRLAVKLHDDWHDRGVRIPVLLSKGECEALALALATLVSAYPSEPLGEAAGATLARFHQRTRKAGMPVTDPYTEEDQ
ncbi:MAG: hypothetical protein ACRDN9_18775 [Streptosporangiaceae bacterium]